MTVYPNINKQHPCAVCLSYVAMTTEPDKRFGCHDIINAVMDEPLKTSYLNDSMIHFITQVKKFPRHFAGDRHYGG